MNLMQEGPHQVADWLLLKLRAFSGPIAVHVSPEGQMVVRRATEEKTWGPTFVGIYTKKVTYKELVEDMSEVVKGLYA